MISSLRWFRFFSLVPFNIILLFKIVYLRPHIEHFSPFIIYLYIGYRRYGCMFWLQSTIRMIYSYVSADRTYWYTFITCDLTNLEGIELHFMERVIFSDYSIYLQLTIFNWQRQTGTPTPNSDEIFCCQCW